LASAPLDGDEALFREVRRMAADIANASFHGAPTRAEALALLGRARLLVATSEEEHLPYAWQEAWANGVPVAVLSDPEGLIAREGLGVAADSPVRLFDAVGALLEDPAALQAAAERCRRYMARAHSEARAVRPYLAAFEAARRRPAMPREHPA
jgi:glycosyltransferase involved in cell wall biosynthesis